MIRDKMTLRRHFFHLVDASPWPLIASIVSWLMAIGLISFMHNFHIHLFILAYALMMLITIMIFWWRDVIREGTYLGYHTKTVQQLLRNGIVLFIVSEVMFFFSFFFAYFSSSIAPTIQIGGVWPPYGITALNPFTIPLSNTLILLLSGLTVTWAHHALLAGDRMNVFQGLFYTICLGIVFTLFQVYEYLHASFQINDGIYGTTFYMTTGFHGFHVLVGTIFLCVMLVRHINHHFTIQHHVGLEGAIWYWHFVDIVWILLYLSMYLWPYI